MKTAITLHQQLHYIASFTIFNSITNTLVQHMVVVNDSEHWKFRLLSTTFCPCDGQRKVRSVIWPPDTRGRWARWRFPLPGSAGPWSLSHLEAAILVREDNASPLVPPTLALLGLVFGWLQGRGSGYEREARCLTTKDFGAARQRETNECLVVCVCSYFSCALPLPQTKHR